MTPKEKAIDFVKDIEFEIPYIHDPTEPQADYIAKQCALIAANEIIHYLEIVLGVDKEDFEYWQEVKQEIKKNAVKQ